MFKAKSSQIIHFLHVSAVIQAASYFLLHCEANWLYILSGLDLKKRERERDCEKLSFIAFYGEFKRCRSGGKKREMVVEE